MVLKVKVVFFLLYRNNRNNTKISQNVKLLQILYIIVKQ